MGVKALLPDLKLSDAQERDIDPDFDLIRVSRLFEIADGTIVCVLSSCPADSDTLVFTVDRQKGLLPVSGLKEVDKLWPAGDELLALIDEAILKIGLDGERRRLLELPEGVESVDASWTDDGTTTRVQSPLATSNSACRWCRELIETATSNSFFRSARIRGLKASPSSENRCPRGSIETLLLGSCNGKPHKRKGVDFWHISVVWG